MEREGGRLRVLTRRWRVIVSPAIVSALAVLAMFAAREAIAQPPHYTGYRYKGPAWSWGANPIVPDPVVSLALEPGGTCGIRFSVEPGVLGVGRSGWRVGLVTGQPGTTPFLWLSSERPDYRRADTSPHDRVIVGGSLLVQARAAYVESGLQVDLRFDRRPDFRSPWDLYLLIDTHSDHGDKFLGADLLLQDVALGAGLRVDLDVPWFEVQPAIVVPGQKITVTACIVNDTSAPIPGIRAQLRLPSGISSKGATMPGIVGLRPWETRRLQWSLTATAT